MRDKNEIRIFNTLTHSEIILTSELKGDKGNRSHKSDKGFN
jgi:hypothetical protein